MNNRQADLNKTMSDLNLVSCPRCGSTSMTVHKFPRASHTVKVKGQKMGLRPSNFRVDFLRCLQCRDVHDMHKVFLD